MPIAAADIQYFGSMGSTAASGANANPNTWLGGTISTTAWAGGALNDLFDDTSSTENSAGDTEYRMIYVKNNHASISWTSVVAYITDNAGGATMAIGLDPAANGANSTTVVANEDTAPAGVTFSSPSTYGTGLSIGTLTAGQIKGIWVRKAVAANTTATASDGFTLNVDGDTT